MAFNEITLKLDGNPSAFSIYPLEVNGPGTLESTPRRIIDTVPGGAGVGSFVFSGDVTYGGIRYQAGNAFTVSGSNGSVNDGAYTVNGSSYSVGLNQTVVVANQAVTTIPNDNHGYASYDTPDENTSLALPGRGVRNYPDHINGSLVALLENFSNTSAPANPVEGQIWHDSNGVLWFWHGGIWNEVFSLNNPTTIYTLLDPRYLLKIQDDTTVGNITIDKIAPQLKLLADAGTAPGKITHENPDNATYPWVYWVPRDGSVLTVEGAATDVGVGTELFRIDESGLVQAGLFEAEGGAMYITADAGNAALWMRNDSGVTRGLFYTNTTGGNESEIRTYAADGTTPTNRLNVTQIDGVLRAGTGQHLIWHEGNDGHGSGLDADTVDTIEGASLLRSDVSDDYTAGTLTIKDAAFFAIEDNSGTPHVIKGAGTYGIVVQPDSDPVSCGRIFGVMNSGGTELMRVNYDCTTGGGTLVVDGYEVWHEGNLPLDDFVSAVADDDKTGNLVMKDDSIYMEDASIVMSNDSGLTRNRIEQIADPNPRPGINAPVPEPYDAIHKQFAYDEFMPRFTTNPASRVGSLSYLPIDIKGDFRGQIVPFSGSAHMIIERDGTLVGLRNAFNGEVESALYFFSSSLDATNTVVVTDAPYEPPFLTTGGKDESVTHVYPGNAEGFMVRTKDNVTSALRYYWIDQNGTLDGTFHTFTEVTTIVNADNLGNLHKLGEGNYFIGISKYVNPMNCYAYDLALGSLDDTTALQVSVGGGNATYPGAYDSNLGPSGSFVSHHSISGTWNGQAFQSTGAMGYRNHQATGLMTHWNGAACIVSFVPSTRIFAGTLLFPMSTMVSLTYNVGTNWNYSILPNQAPPYTGNLGNQAASPNYLDDNAYPMWIDSSLNSTNFWSYAQSVMPSFDTRTGQVKVLHARVSNSLGTSFDVGKYDFEDYDALVSYQNYDVVYYDDEYYEWLNATPSTPGTAPGAGSWSLINNSMWYRWMTTHGRSGRRAYNTNGTTQAFSGFTNYIPPDASPLGKNLLFQVFVQYNHIMNMSQSRFTTDTGITIKQSSNWITDPTTTRTLEYNGATALELPATTTWIDDPLNTQYLTDIHLEINRYRYNKLGTLLENGGTNHRTILFNTTTRTHDVRQVSWTGGATPPALGGVLSSSPALPATWETDVEAILAAQDVEWVNAETGIDDTGPSRDFTITWVKDDLFLVIYYGLRAPAASLQGWEKCLLVTVSGSISYVAGSMQTLTDPFTLRNKLAGDYFGIPAVSNGTGIYYTNDGSDKVYVLTDGAAWRTSSSAGANLYAVEINKSTNTIINDNLAYPLAIWEKAGIGVHTLFGPYRTDSFSPSGAHSVMSYRKSVAVTSHQRILEGFQSMLGLGGPAVATDEVILTVSSGGAFSLFTSASTRVFIKGAEYEMEAKEYNLVPDFFANLSQVINHGAGNPLYVYVELVQSGTVELTVLDTEVADTFSLFKIGTIETDADKITAVNIDPTTRIDVYKVTTVPTANAVPVSGTDGKIDAGWLPAGIGNSTVPLSGNFVHADVTHIGGGVYTLTLPVGLEFINDVTGYNFPISVSINGKLLSPGVDYSITGTNLITFLAGTYGIPGAGQENYILVYVFNY